MMLHQNLKQINVKDFLVAENFPKTPSPKPARIHSPDPFLRAESKSETLPNFKKQISLGFAKIHIPRK